LKLPLPSLTVVIPNFNHGHLIEDQLRSIFAQTVQPAKILVIDDASTDNSVSVIRSLISSRKNVEVICKEANSGVVRAMNDGLHVAETECIGFLAADDMILPGMFEKSLALLARHTEAALCSGVSLVHHLSGNHEVPNRAAYPCSTSAFLNPAGVRSSLLVLEDWFMGNTTIFRREPLLAAGGFDLDLGSFADGFLSRVLALRHGACFIPEPLAIWRRVDAGYASSTRRDDGGFEQIMLIANARMSTTFKDLFPSDLIARCTARMLFRVLCARLDNFEARVRELLVAVQPVALGSMFPLVIRWATRILKLLLFGMLRFRDIPRVALSKLARRRLPTPEASARSD